MTAPPPLQGLYVDLIAPCAADGHLLSREYQVHLRRMARVRDIQGVVVNGPAGEAPVLDSELRMKTLQAAAAAAPGGFPVYAAVRADEPDVERETRAALERGATGVVVLGGGEDDANDGAERSLNTVVRAAGDRPVIAWNLPAPLIAKTPGVCAIVSDTAGLLDADRNLPVMLTDRNFDLSTLTDGRAAGAVLGSANVAEAIWGRVFRFAAAAPADAESLLADRVGPLQRVLVDLAAADGPGGRTAAAAIKYALCTMTQNTSAATFPPLLDIGDDVRDRVSRALTDGRLLPGMA